MTTPIKNPTIWRPPGGAGAVLYIGFVKVLDNVSKLPILDNVSKLPVLAGPTSSTPKNPTVWTQIG
jgi:hypothetical protein